MYKKKNTILNFNQGKFPINYEAYIDQFGQTT